MLQTLHASLGSRGLSVPEALDCRRSFGRENGSGDVFVGSTDGHRCGISSRKVGLAGSDYLSFRGCRDRGRRSRRRQPLCPERVSNCDGFHCLQWSRFSLHGEQNSAILCRGTLRFAFLYSGRPPRRWDILLIARGANCGNPDSAMGAHDLILDFRWWFVLAMKLQCLLIAEFGASIGMCCLLTFSFFQRYRSCMALPDGCGRNFA